MEAPGITEGRFAIAGGEDDAGEEQHDVGEQGECGVTRKERDCRRDRAACD